jgi:hypothetical protein
MAEAAKALLSVTQTRSGIWSVNERGPSRVAIAYFPSKWGALKHALRVARAKRRCRVAVLEADGAVQLARDYEQGPDSHHVETP